MKHLALLTIILAASTSAFAGRRALNEENYAQILATGKQDMLRVYLSSKLTLEKSSSSTQIEVEIESLRKESNVEIERLVISKNVKGKIVDVTYTNSQYVRDIYVSFDSTCLVKECALKYSRLGNLFSFTGPGSEFKDAKATYGGIFFGAQDNYLTFNNEDFKNVTTTTNFAPGFN